MMVMQFRRDGFKWQRKSCNRIRYIEDANHDNDVFNNMKSINSTAAMINKINSARIIRQKLHAVHRGAKFSG